MFIHSVFLLSSVASALSLLGSWAFLPPLSVSLLSDVWHLSSRKLFGVPVGFTSSSPLLGGVLFDLVPILSWVFSPGFGRGFLPHSGGTTPVWSSAAF